MWGEAITTLVSSIEVKGEEETIIGIMVMGILIVLTDLMATTRDAGGIGDETNK